MHSEQIWETDAKLSISSVARVVLTFNASLIAFAPAGPIEFPVKHHIKKLVILFHFHEHLIYEPEMLR